MKYHVILRNEKRKNNNDIVRWLQTQNSFSLSAINTFILATAHFDNIKFPHTCMRKQHNFYDIK